MNLDGGAAACINDWAARIEEKIDYILSTLRRRQRIAFATLVERGRIYPCYESEAELAAYFAPVADELPV